MVGKIMKHELHALFRVLVFLFAAVLLLSVLLRLLLLGDTYTDGWAGAVILLINFYFYAMLAAVIVAAVLGIYRFYKSLFTGEGYLTLALPATPAQLIWAKLLSALIAVYSAVAVCALSALIFFAGFSPEFYAELAENLGDLFAMYGAYFSSDPLLVVESVLATLVSIPEATLFFFLVASVGQLFTRHRKGMTALIAIGSLFVLLLFSALVYQPLLDLLALNLSVHLANWLDILVVLLIDAGCFLLVRYILSHRANLIV